MCCKDGFVWRKSSFRPNAKYHTIGSSRLRQECSMNILIHEVSVSFSMKAGDKVLQWSEGLNAREQTSTGLFHRSECKFLPSINSCMARDRSLGQERDDCSDPDLCGLLHKEIELRAVLENANAQRQLDVRFMQKRMVCGNLAASRSLVDLNNAHVVGIACAVNNTDVITNPLPHHMSEMCKLLASNGQSICSDLFRRSIEVF